MKSRSLVFAALAAIGAAGSLIAEEAGPPSPATRVEFNRDIRPILSDACFQCHGPDQAKRKADLRFDTEAGARADLGGHRALVPRDLEKSELFQRIIATDPEERMPPAKSGKTLTTSQIELIRRWIEEGAEWQKHWSFIPPARPPLPAVRERAWPRNAIDHFVLARLERDGLRPALEADRTTLIRRVSLDLTGLPPTPEEVDAFVGDSSEDAYEKIVDRLLASPRFGERMAVRWLDGARYADTSGYQSDGERVMWRWRDWVVDAFNANLPFDRFTIEQLAGDMLPGATLDQKIASGFNRNHRGNSEGGIIPEEYAVEYVVDRVETTFTVWMGLTIGCGRCHDHKFDPLTQREFYQAFAFFNNVPELGRAMKLGNSPPFIKTPTRDQQERLARLDERLERAEAGLREARRLVPAALTAWEASVDPTELADWHITDGLRVHVPLNGDAKDAKWEGGPSGHVSGRIGEAGVFDGTQFVNAGDAGAFGYLDKFTISAWIKAEGNRGGTILSRMTDAEEGDGYSLVLEQGRLQLNLVKRWLDDALRVETLRPLPPGEWHHVLATYDGSRSAAGVSLYVDGEPQPQKVLLDLLNQSFATKEPLRIGGGNGPQGRFHGLIDDVRIYDRPFGADEAEVAAVAEPVDKLLRGTAPPPGTPRWKKLQFCFLERGAPESIRSAELGVKSLRHERERLFESIPTTMVMEEMPTPRETHVLIRGEYDKPGDRVVAGTPACLPSDAAGFPRDRLGFARWLVSGEHPLTARVAVNRFWQMLFGTGLVKTVDDFGAQGEWPSHPELLDWLAVEYRGQAAGDRRQEEEQRTEVRGTENTPQTRASLPKSEIRNPTFPSPPWDTKRLLRLLVTSATYRQSSRGAAESLRVDPENRLLSRGPRLRLPAEMVRDQALFAAGLLVEQQGGPSVKPYQPAGLWKELADSEYVQDHGAGLYRRGMYTFWKRTVPPPTMITFDSAGRETCIVRETRTNTPLQALTLMNDVTFVEAARALAERAMREAGPAPADRLTRAFRLALSRPPRPSELELLLSGWHTQRERYAKDPAAAEQFLSQGEWPRDPKMPPADLAAYAAIASMILNLDEAITRE